MYIDKIISALDGAVLGKGRLYDPHTQLYCALGRLLHNAGVPDATLECEWYHPSAKSLHILAEEYGLESPDAAEIVLANDSIAPKRSRVNGRDVLKEVGYIG